jgi:DNA-binding CsgD family transcriptional regulator
MQITGRTGWLLSVVGAVAFVAFLALELSVEKGPLTLAKVALEAFELLLIMGTAAVTALLFTQFRAHRDEQAALVAELERARSQGQAWREKAQKHIAGLSAAIQEQFDQWGLSPAESEVAMLMLKGFSHKEIARLRNAGEQTVRQQARVVYAKADVSSRHAFCAFFLEDLLVPAEDEEDESSLVSASH